MMMRGARPMHRIQLPRTTPCHFHFQDGATILVPMTQPRPIHIYRSEQIMPSLKSRRGSVLGARLLALSTLTLLTLAMCSCWIAPAPALGRRHGRRRCQQQQQQQPVVMLSESRSFPQPRKSEAYDEAARDKGAPAVVLVRPYLDENIGSCARAMLNFGLTDLRIVKPFCDHLTDAARARSSGADAILENARVYGNLMDAVADLEEVVGTSARQRDMTIRVVTPEQAAGMAVRALRAFEQQQQQQQQPGGEEGVCGGGKLGFLFGSERNGLTNAELVYSSCLLQIPTTSAFSSLNLGQAVQIVGYEWWKVRSGGGQEKEGWLGVAKGTRMANVGEIEGLWGRCQELLDAVELNPNPVNRALIYARFKNLLVRSESDVRDVNALHGALTALAVNHERLEPLRQRHLEANKSHGTRRRGGKRMRPVALAEEEEDDSEGDEEDLSLDEGVTRTGRREWRDEALEEERREREAGW